MNYQQPYPQNHQPYPAYPPPQQGYYPPPQQVIYEERPRSRWDSPNTSWLMSILLLCCGCFLGEALCDENCCCCLIPCALPSFGGRRY